MIPVPIGGFNYVSRVHPAIWPSPSDLDSWRTEGLSAFGRFRLHEENPAVEEAFKLRNAGFWVIPIYPPGYVRKSGQITAGKEPIGKAWGKRRWSEAKLRKTFQWQTMAGIGICLGHRRGPGWKSLIDVEIDGEDGWDALAKLFGGALPETMGWSSARGGHFLFVLEDHTYWGLHNAIARFGREGTGHKRGVWHLPSAPGLEFRLGGYKPDRDPKQVQSVCPPTPGTDGKPRQWNACPAPISWPDSATETLRAMGLAERGTTEEEHDEREPLESRAYDSRDPSVSGSSGGGDEEDILRHPVHLASRIAIAIERAIPSEGQKRHVSLLRLTTELRHIDPEATVDQAMPHFESWHARAVSFMEEKNIEFNRAEFVRAWVGAKPNTWIVPRAKERARGSAAAFMKNEKQNMMARLLQAMAIEKGDRTFFLSYDEIGTFVGWPNAESVRYAADRLADAGLVKVVAPGERGLGRKEDGTPRQATVWQWLGPLEPGKG